jgi:hypothetical protein
MNISKDHFQDMGANTDTNAYSDADTDNLQKIKSVKSVK